MYHDFTDEKTKIPRKAGEEAGKKQEGGKYIMDHVG